MTILTSDGKGILSGGFLRRAYNATAPNEPDFGTTAVQYVDGIWYLMVSNIPGTIDDPIDQVRLVIFREVGGVEVPPYKLPLVTLSPNIFIECGPGEVLDADEGTVVVGIEAVENGLSGRLTRVRDVTLGDEPPVEEILPVVEWTLSQGDEPGELVISITSITNGTGENPIPIYIKYSLNGTAFENLDDGTLAVEDISLFTTPNTLTSIRLQWSNDFRTFPASDPQEAVSGQEEIENPEPPVWNFPVTQVFTEGDPFSVDWRTYCENGEVFEVVVGFTGGVSSSTSAFDEFENELYSVASLVPENVDITVTATNSEGSAVGIWPLVVEPMVFAPSVVRPVADQSLVNGDTLLIKLDGPDGVFSGTEPMTFSVTPSSDPDFTLNQVAHTFGNDNLLEDARTSFPVTLTATNSAGSAEESFNISVSIVREAAPEWGVDVTMSSSENTYTDWRTGVVSYPNAPGTLYWTRSVPDTNDTVPVTEYEEFESLGNDLYRMRMTDPLKRGNPDVQTATVALGTDPIAVTSGSNNIIITKASHGMGVGRRVTIANAPAFNGLTAAQVNGNRQIIAVTTNTFTVQAGANATSTDSTAGGAGITYTANRADFSVMAPGDTANIRVAYLGTGDVVSHWSLPMAVPQVVTLGERYWRFNSRRTEEAFDADWVGSIGNQYQHVVTFNKSSLRDPSKKYYMFTGQDENGISFSPDGGRTISPIVGFGMWGSSINGLYYCSDDFTNGILLALGGHGSTTGKCGLYGSVDEGRICKRIRLNRTNGADAFASNRTYFPRANHNLIDRRPQNASGTLTDSQRPIYVIAQQKDGGGSFIGCYLFKWAGGDVFNSSDWTQVYEWPVADIRGSSPTIGDESGMMYIRVAPNGDVIVGGRRGVWFSTDGGATFTQRSTLSVRGMAVDMTTTGVSGCFISISNKADADDPAVLKTANIRTTNFSNPGNTNLPANAIAQSLEGPASNFNRLYVVYKTGSSYAAKFSTNGGQNWNNISVVAPPGYDDSANSWRYTWGGGRGPGIYPHPTDLNHVFGMVFISGAVSTNGGSIFRGDANAFFDHAHTKGWGYDRLDFTQLYTMLQDSGSFHQNGMEWYEELGLKWDLGGNAATAGRVKDENGVNGTPFNFAVQVGGIQGPGRTQGRGATSLHETPFRVFALSADNTNVRCIPCIKDAGNTWVCRTDVGWSRCARFFHHPTNENVIIMGKWFISGWKPTTPGGPLPSRSDIVFTHYNNREVIGYSMVNGQPVWYFGGSGNGGNQIFRAPNANGSGGVLWKTLDSTADYTAMTPDPFNDGVVYVSRGNQDGKVERHTAGSSTVIFNAATAITSLYAANGVSTTGRPNILVDHVFADYNKEGLLYMSMDTPGLPIIFMTEDCTAVSPTWTNETRNLPHTYHWMPTIHPVTGEVFINSSMGEFVLPAPDDYPSIPNKNYFTNWMDNYYGRADIPDPPILPGV